jgi:hypothetical protein
VVGWRTPVCGCAGGVDGGFSCFPTFSQEEKMGAGEVGGGLVAYLFNSGMLLGEHDGLNNQNRGGDIER